jgi:hypothetical protein
VVVLTEGTALIGFILQGPTLQSDHIVPAFTPPYDIIHQMAQEIKKAASLEAACPILLPLLDELRTFCFEHKIEEIPVLLAV